MPLKNKYKCLLMLDFDLFPDSPLPSPKFARHSNQRTSSPSHHSSSNCDSSETGSMSGRAANSSHHYTPPSPGHARASNCSQGIFEVRMTLVIIPVILAL